MSDLKAPMPYFGGKATIAHKVWQALGQPKTYIEPFFGSGAVLLARPHYVQGEHIETVVDADGYVANVWRALQADPDEVAKWCDWPVNHFDLSARKRRLIAEGEALSDHLMADETYYDAKLAGYWIWAASCWIGSGLTSLGPIPHVGHGGMGVHALGQIPHIGSGGTGVQEPYNTNIYEWFRRLSERLRYARVVAGDWTRVCGGDWQDTVGDVGMFFDPPYGVEDRDPTLYHQESLTVAQDVAKWCVERGDRPSYRIVLAGYYEEHEWLLERGWKVETWKAVRGYGAKGNKNRFREALFYSPHCKYAGQQRLI